MKAFIATLVAAAFCAPAFAADPVGQRTPNGGFEYYSNYHAGKGTVEHGCILPWRAAGYVTHGYNPKLVHYGDPSEFFDCKIEPKKVVVVVKEVVPVVVAPVVVAPAPVAVVPAEPVPQPKKIRE